MMFLFQHMTHLGLSHMTPLRLSAMALAIGMTPVFAMDEEPPAKIVELEQISIIADSSAQGEVLGAANEVDSFVLEEYEYQDFAQVAQRIPGVYAREEDGYGLRPNIGIRGATSERSQKITLMEDGLLIAPAPYAAPAAYYFPNMGRMSSVEVFKGPSAIKYGPHTVGGAVNLVSEPIQADFAKLNLSYGTDNTALARGVYSDIYQSESGEWGVLFEALRYQSDGFKTVDNANSAGFQRNDLNAKLSWQSPSTASYPQTFLLKLGYADEDSEETYLGITDEDFEQNSTRRYAASQQDAFETSHQQVHVFHDIQWSEQWSLSTAVYWNAFARDWNKLDGFRAAEGLVAVEPADVFANPSVYSRQLSLLKGEIDSETTFDQLNIVGFDRDYYSYGVQAQINQRSEFSLAGASIQSVRQMGLRYHGDGVERDHTGTYYDMTDGELVTTNESENFVHNEDKAQALAGFYFDQLAWQDWQLSYGLRFESINTERTDKLAEQTYQQTQQVWLPGVGLRYQVSEALALQAGVHRGFSPNAASSTQAEPETSINYELGGALSLGAWETRAIAFYSDYENLIGRCRVSDGSSCDTSQEYNAGRVAIVGLELESSAYAELGEYLLPVSVVYTWTQSEFQESFDSSFSQWGSVEKGDELPYLPEHTLRFDTGIESDVWAARIAMNYRSEMREIAGQDAMNASNSVRELTTFDFSADYQVTDQWLVSAKVENIFDRQEIVSRRPFGARPNKPRYFTVGTQYEF